MNHYLGCVVAVLLFVTPSRGAPVTVFFSGIAEVDNEYGMLPREIVDGDSFFGTLTYDLDTELGDTPYDVSRYWTGPFGLSLYVKGHAFRPTGDSTTSVNVGDDVSYSDAVAFAAAGRLIQCNDFESAGRRARRR